MLGKAGRLFCALTLPTLISAPVMADTISGGDTAWILTSTALVLFMTIPGLSLFYGGARARQECAVGVNAVLCADGADVSALVCGGLYAGIWLLRG